MERFEMSGEALIAMSILAGEQRDCKGVPSEGRLGKCIPGEGMLGEECIILYGTDRERLKSIDELDAAQLLSIVRTAKERLEALRGAEGGCASEAGGEKCSGPSEAGGEKGSCASEAGGEKSNGAENRRDETIRITRDLRIMLPGRGGEEIRMRPITKSVFLLFLRHPEGIRFKEIGDYEEELAGYYSKLSRHTDLEQFNSSLRRVLGQEDCTLSIAASRLTSKMKSVFGDGLWERYSIRGAAGEAKAISLDRKYVIWE